MIRLMEEAGEDGAASGAGTPPKLEGLADLATPPPDPNAPPPAEGRPDYIPEKYWKEGKLVENATELMAKEIAYLQTKVRTGKDEPPKGEAPKPEDYEFTVPVDVAVEIAPDDPIVKWFKEEASGLGIAKEAAQKLFDGFVRASAAITPPPMDVAAEMKKLGPNAQNVINDVMGRAHRLQQLGVFSDQDIAEYKIAAGTAEGMKMMAKMIDAAQKGLLGNAPVPSSNVIPSASGLPSGEELRAMKFAKVEEGPNAGRMKIEVDPEYKKRIDALYDSVYGKENTGQSRIQAGG
jgi:hypothetical protein